MKLTKTIAAVAAVALTVSAMSFAALADAHAEDHSFSGWTSNGASGHTGTCTLKNTDDDENEVACTETKTEAHDTDGADGACSKCGYKEESSGPAAHDTHEAADDAAWQKDATNHWKACKVDGCTEKVGSAAHTWGEGDDANKCTVCNYEKSTTPVTPGPSEGGNEGGNEGGSSGDSEATDADKIATAIANLESGYFTWDFASWFDVNDQGHLDTLISQAVANAGVEGIEASLVNYTTGSNGMVTFTIKFKVGTEEVTKDVTLQCLNNAAGDGSSNGGDDEENTTIPDPIVSTPGSSSASSDAAAEQVVESPKDVAASRKPDLTVNAAESGVSEDIVAAFTSNKTAKTLTLKYSSTLKVAIAKEDISDAAAKLDFSVSGEKFLSSKQVKKLGATKVVQLDFVSTGKLDGVDKATIKSSVGMGYVGKTVTVYEMVNGKLVKVGVAKVNGAGIVKFDTDHLGQFVLAVK